MLAQPPVWFILIAFVCALGPLVFFHELGHYLVARWFGVGAEVFSIGFGREIIGWRDQRGTRWKIGWLPLGGYVRFVGDMNPASTPVSENNNLSMELRNRSFHHKPVWQRFLIVLAGPLANFLLAIGIFAAFFAIQGVPRTPAMVQSVMANSAADRAGILPGDRIMAVAGRSVDSFEDLLPIVAIRPGQNVSVDLVRNGSSIRTTARIGRDVQRDRFGQRYEVGRLGILAVGRQFEPVPLPQLLPTAALYVRDLTVAIADGLWQIISGRLSMKQLGGPLKMAQTAGQHAALGTFEFIWLVAIFSINLGFINLLPVPLLDGGHLFFYAVEAVRRSPVSLRTQEWAFRGGLALILALLVFTTVNDLDSFGLWDRLERLIG